MMDVPSLDAGVQALTERTSNTAPMITMAVGGDQLATVRTVAELRSCVQGWRARGLRVGFVPTMGALHEGHLSLVRLAKQTCDKVVVSIFVNPKQFAPTEDFAKYPRDEAGDTAKVASAGCDLIYAPTVEIMYPANFVTKVDVGGITDMLCGAFRPHFFGGVATVVCKLLLQCLPDLAIFGEKDYQQLLVIKSMARDLDIPVTIIGGPTVREGDGLAMSSRNAYLTPTQRTQAALLYGVLTQIKANATTANSLSHALESGRRALGEAGFKLDYLDVRDDASLALVEAIPHPRARAFVAAWLGQTRLIDNLDLTPDR